MSNECPSLNLGNLGVLVVEDNPHMRSIVKEILRALQVRNIQSAGDGKDAIEKLGSFHADLIICDWEMSPMDGITFTKLLRTSAQSKNPYVPLILLTGHTSTERVNTARDAGITEFLAKPVSISRLYERISWMIEHPRPFIKTDHYSGPCRRRSQTKDETNRGRRASDNSSDPVDQPQEAVGS